MPHLSAVGISGLQAGEDVKYRLAYVVCCKCVLRYDNEVGKGDHPHVGGIESVYTFASPEQLITDFQRDIERWNDENRDS